MAEGSRFTPKLPHVKLAVAHCDQIIRPYDLQVKNLHDHSIEIRMAWSWTGYDYDPVFRYKDEATFFQTGRNNAEARLLSFHHKFP